MQGLVLSEAGLAPAVSAAAFEAGLLIETAGPDDEVLKFLPPLIVSLAEIDRAVGVVAEALEQATAGSALESTEGIRFCEPLPVGNAFEPEYVAVGSP